MLELIVKLNAENLQLRKELNEARDANRQNALQKASNIIGNKNLTSPEYVVEFARSLEAYLNSGSQGNV